MNTLEIIAEPSDPYLGATLGSRYRLDAQLGTGAMGAVYRAWDLHREAACAVKLLSVSGLMREAAGLRFVDEARIVAGLFHPNIVEVYDHGAESDGTRYIVMELLKGQDLESLVKAKGRLPLDQTLDIVRQIGSALHTVHLIGIVHRDIKPRNIFLCRQDAQEDRFLVKVIDFGLAKLLHAGRTNRGSDGMLIGTPEYLPPEAWYGVSANVDARADQWSLAVLTFRMLSGQMPFESTDNTVLLAQAIKSQPARRLSELVPSIPEHIDLALARALSKDKAARFSTVHDFIRALLQLPQALPQVLPQLVPDLYQHETVIRPAPDVNDIGATSLLPLHQPLRNTQETQIRPRENAETAELKCAAQTPPPMSGQLAPPPPRRLSWFLSSIGISLATACSTALLLLNVIGENAKRVQPAPLLVPAAVEPLSVEPPSKAAHKSRMFLIQRSVPTIPVKAPTQRSSGPRSSTPSLQPANRSVRHSARGHFTPQNSIVQVF